MRESGESVHGDSGKGGDAGGGERERDKERLRSLKAGLVFGAEPGKISGEVVSDSLKGSYERRRPLPSSYKDKLLSLSQEGFLVTHEEEEDIMNGWKAYFMKENREESEKGDDDLSDLGMMEDGASEGRTPTLKMTAEEYTAWCQPWMNSLIIKVLGANFPTHIRDRINRMWRPRDPLKIISLNNGYYIVSFTTSDDRDYAFQDGPWMIDDHYLIVQRWRPNFNPWTADLQRRIAAWIRLPDLPMELYNVESLRRIGNMVGKIVKIDRSTSIYDKGGFARICAELDLQKPLLPSFNVFGEDRPIVYEGLHLVCFNYGRYGHKKTYMPSRKR